MFSLSNAIYFCHLIKATFHEYTNELMLPDLLLRHDFEGV